LRDGRVKVRDGRVKVRDGRVKVRDGRVEVRDGRVKVNRSKETLPVHSRDFAVKIKVDEFSHLL